MPKFYCDYCDTYLTHDSPSVRKTHCSGRKHKENVKDYYQKWMEEQAQSLIDKTTRENPTYTVLGTTSRRSHDTTSSQHPWPPAAWHDAGPSHGWTANDANDGPTPTRDDASWTRSRDEATDGRTHADDAGAPDDETTLQTHDGANQARNDPSRQIKVEMELPVLFHIMIFHMIKYHRPMSLGFCIKTVCRGNLLLLQIADGLT